MVNKRQVRRNIKRLQRIKTWQLLILLILAGFVSATFLRLNNVGMVQRRDAVLAADESGDQESIRSRLYELQHYVSAHMNTNMGGGIYLENQYQRDYESALAAASSSTGSAENVYKEVTDACQAQYTIWSAYFQCVTDRLGSMPDGSDLSANVQFPKAEAYRHDFASPLWSPDFAGWSIVVCAVLLLVIIARLVGLLALNIILRWRNKSF